MARTQQLLRRGFSNVSKRNIRVRSARSRRGTGMSGTDVLSNEPSRIETYIKSHYLNNIIDMASAREAVNSLRYNSKSSFRE